MAKEIERPKPTYRAMDLLVSIRLVNWAVGSKNDESVKESYRQEIQEVAVELAGPDPSPIEWTLAESAALAWFALRLHEMQFAGGSCSGTGLTIHQSDHSQRQIDRAHRRYLATLKTLATVRRLALPALQINLARRQVNVVGSLSASNPDAMPRPGRILEAPPDFSIEDSPPCPARRS